MAEIDDPELPPNEFEREREALLDSLELFGIALLAEKRLSSPAPREQLLTIGELSRALGFDDLVAE